MDPATLRLTRVPVDAAPEPRVFRRKNSAPLIRDDDLLTQLNGALSIIEKAEEQLLQKGRLLTTRQVVPKETSQEVEAALTALTKARSKQETLYNSIPAMQDLNKMAKAVSAIVYQDIVSTSIEEKAHTLHRLVTSTHIAKALTVYKAKVEAISALSTNKTSEDKVSGLIALFREAVTDFDAIGFSLQGKEETIVNTATLLFKELLLFLQYAKNQVYQGLTHDDTKLKASLERLEQRLQERLATLPPTPSNPGPNSEKRALSYVKSAFGCTLSADHPLRKIEQEKLHNIAKALLQLSLAVKALTKEHISQSAPNASTELHNFKSLSLDLEWLIQIEFQKLQEKPFTTRCHATWCSIAYLLSELAGIREQLSLLEETLVTTYRLPLAALHKLTSYLASPNGTVKSLIEVIENVRALKIPKKHEATPRARVYTLLEECLVTTHEKSTAPSEDEATMLQFLLTNGNPNEALKSYLIKGLIRAVHFPHTPNAEFDLAFYIAKGDPLYAGWFQQVCNTSSEFRNLEMVYEQSIVHHNHDLQFLKEAITNLTTKHDTKEELQLGYAEAQELLTILQKTPRSKHLATWLETQLKKFYHEHEASLDIERELGDEASKELYHNLRETLFNPTSVDNVEAHTKILGFISNPQHELAPKGFLQLLIARWLLTHRFNSNSFLELQQQEKQRLQDFFRSYVSDADIRAIWEKQFSLGYMEEQLYTFLLWCEQQPEYGIDITLSGSRQNEHYSLWKQVMNCYKNVTTLRKKHDFFEKESKTQKDAIALVDEAKGLIGEENMLLASKVSPKTHLDFAVCCYEEMVKLTSVAGPR